MEGSSFSSPSSNELSFDIQEPDEIILNVNPDKNLQ